MTWMASRYSPPAKAALAAPDRLVTMDLSKSLVA
jgi:hypothetical protein